MLVLYAARVHSNIYNNNNNNNNIYICQDGGAVGFVDFTELLFALSSLAQ